VAALVIRGTAYHALKQLDLAKIDFDKAIAHAPKESAAYATLGLAKKLTGPFPHGRPKCGFKAGTEPALGASRGGVPCAIVSLAAPAPVFMQRLPVFSP
jgi:hypothetical protein